MTSSSWAKVRRSSGPPEIGHVLHRDLTTPILLRRFSEVKPVEGANRANRRILPSRSQGFRLEFIAFLATKTTDAAKPGMTSDSSRPRPQAHLNEIVEVLANVFQVRQDMAPAQIGTYSVAHVLIGTAIVLIDTGILGREASILGLLSDLGRSPRDIVAILNTHGHADHIGSNVVLARMTGAPVHLHRNDRFYLDGAKQMWGGDLVPTAPADVLLSDGDILEFGDLRLEVVHLPGHSAGSVGYWDRQRDILYCGDAVQGRGSTIQNLPLYFDPDAYERSVVRVGAIDVQNLIPSHPYLPLSSCIASGSQVNEFVSLSLEVYRSLDGQIRDVVQNAPGPITVEKITAPLCARNGFATITSMATTTVRAHLERMRRHGTATMKNLDGTLYWVLR